VAGSRRKDVAAAAAAADSAAAAPATVPAAPYGNSSEIVPRYLGFTTAFPPENSIDLDFDPESGSMHPRDFANPSQACDSPRPSSEIEYSGNERCAVASRQVLSSGPPLPGF